MNIRFSFDVVILNVFISNSSSRYVVWLIFRSLGYNVFNFVDSGRLCQIWHKKGIWKSYGTFIMKLPDIH